MENLERYRGKYLKPNKVKKIKHPKGNELQRISLCTLSHNSKMSNHSGAI